MFFFLAHSKDSSQPVERNPFSPDESKSGTAMNKVHPAAADGRRASCLDTPAVVFDKSAKKEAHQKWKERRATVTHVHHVVAKANERQKEVDCLNDLKKELVMVSFDD